MHLISIGAVPQLSLSLSLSFFLAQSLSKTHLFNVLKVSFHFMELKLVMKRGVHNVAIQILDTIKIIHISYDDQNLFREFSNPTAVCWVRDSLANLFRTLSLSLN